jgi:hypothetical protein
MSSYLITVKSSNTAPVDSVEDCQFEPIKGYPMLNCKGKRPFTIYEVSFGIG